MSRFRNLEFGGESEQNSEFETPSTNDERTLLTRSRRAFEDADFDLALRLYARALEFNPMSEESWTGQVRALIELGEYREAEMWSDKALEHLPNNGDLLAAKAVALARMGRIDEALAFSDASMQDAGDSAYRWLSRGDVLLTRREKAADYCIEKAIHLSRGEWWIIWLASRIRYYHRQFAAGLKLARQALETHASVAILWVQTGLCQAALGMADAAAHSFEQARQLAPGSAALARAMTKLPTRGLFSRIKGLLNQWNHG